MNSAMARASTLSFMVMPHWCETSRELRSMSFIDLKMFCLVASRATFDIGLFLLVLRLAAEAELPEDLAGALLRNGLHVLEGDGLGMRLRPDRLQRGGGVVVQVAVLLQPGLE